jgi:hypothetical protein
LIIELKPVLCRREICHLHNTLAQSLLQSHQHRYQALPLSKRA